MKHGYKKKINGSKQLIQTYEKELENFDIENQTLRKTVENENHTAQLKLREVLLDI